MMYVGIAENGKTVKCECPDNLKGEELVKFINANEVYVEKIKESDYSKFSSLGFVRCKKESDENV